VPSPFVPLIRRATVDHSTSRAAGSADVGSTRVCSVTGMGQLHERIALWDPPRGYAYQARGRLLPLTAHLGVFFVQLDDAGGSVLVWRQSARAERPHVIVFRPWRAVSGAARWPTCARSSAAGRPGSSA